MSRLIARTTLMILVLLVILYIATFVAANTSITGRGIQTKVIINASASRVGWDLTDFEAYPSGTLYPSGGWSRLNRRSADDRAELGSHAITFWASMTLARFRYAGLRSK